MVGQQQVIGGIGARRYALHAHFDTEYARELGAPALDVDHAFSLIQLAEAQPGQQQAVDHVQAEA